MPKPCSSRKLDNGRKRFSTPVTSSPPGPCLDFYIYNIKIAVPGQQPRRLGSAEKRLIGITYPLPPDGRTFRPTSFKMGDIPGETLLIGERRGQRTPTPQRYTVGENRWKFKIVTLNLIGRRVEPKRPKGRERPSIDISTYNPSDRPK